MEGYLHKWKGTDREGFKRPFKEVFSKEKRVQSKFTREFGGDRAVADSLDLVRPGEKILLSDEGIPDRVSASLDIQRVVVKELALERSLELVATSRQAFSAV